MFCCVALTACGSTQAGVFDTQELLGKETGTQSEEQETEEVLYRTDIHLDSENSDWTLETVCAKNEYFLRILDADGASVWESDPPLAVPKAMWGSYYLVRQDEEDMLLSYTLEDEMGMSGDYRYKLFTIKDGKEVVVEEDEVVFDECFLRDSDEEPNFPENEMLAFANELNGYLSNAILLLDFYQTGDAVYSTEDNIRSYTEQYAEILELIGEQPSSDIASDLAQFHQCLQEQDERLAQ